MKLLIISAGPGLEQIRAQYGHATDWFSNLINHSDIDIDINNIYTNEDFDEKILLNRVDLYNLITH